MEPFLPIYAFLAVQLLAHLVYKIREEKMLEIFIRTSLAQEGMVCQHCELDGA